MRTLGKAIRTARTQQINWQEKTLQIFKELPFKTSSNDRNITGRIINRSHD